MKRLNFITKHLAVVSALVITLAVLISCAARVEEDPTEPVVSKEASIPVAASEPLPDIEPISQEEPEPKTALPILKEQPAVINRPEPAAPQSSIDDPWFLVAEVKGDREYMVYVDTKSIENAADGVVSWSKLVFAAPQRDEDGLTYDEVHIESSIDCEGRTYAYNTSKFYNTIGQLVYQEDISYNRSDITPDTLSAYISDFVCGYDFEKDS